MEELYKKTNGELIDRTVAFSGASGGSLGLALYTALSHHLIDSMSIDEKLLKDRISEISTDNYTSSDLTLTFGLDTWRKLWPLNLGLALPGSTLLCNANVRGARKWKES